MKLRDLLAVINEHEAVLISGDVCLVDLYNERDAIDHKWDDCEVLGISVDYITRNLRVDIKEG